MAAIDSDTAEEAIDLIDVEWEPLPAVFDAEVAMQEGAPLVHDDKERNIAMTMDIERGDVERAFAESDVVVEDTYQSMPQWHCAIETKKLLDDLLARSGGINPKAWAILQINLWCGFPPTGPLAPVPPAHK